MSRRRRRSRCSGVNSGRDATASSIMASTSAATGSSTSGAVPVVSGSCGSGSGASGPVGWGVIVGCSLSAARGLYLQEEYARGLRSSLAGLLFSCCEREPRPVPLSGEGVARWTGDCGPTDFDQGVHDTSPGRRRPPPPPRGQERSTSTPPPTRAVRDGMGSMVKATATTGPIRITRPTAGTCGACGPVP